MTQDGGKYSPVRQRRKKVCEPGDFPISVIGLDHAHIYGMVGNLLEAGASLLWVWDRDPAKSAQFRRAFAQVEIAAEVDAIYQCSQTKMILSAIVASERWQVGNLALQHGKHYMSDKTGFTELEQLQVARKQVAETGLKWSICFSERLQSESAIHAGQLIAQGVIGQVIQVISIAPHRLAAATRPAWFFQKRQYGGILCDIGSHQIEQLLYFTGSAGGEVCYSQVGNFAHPETPELEDFGDCMLRLDSGATGYCRLDWFTPEGLGTWGDGRLFILGTEGYLEARKYIDIALSEDTDHLYVVNQQGRERIACAGQIGFPYFGQLILDCLHGTDKALSQEHVFESSRLAIEAERQARRLAFRPERNPLCPK